MNGPSGSNAILLPSAEALRKSIELSTQTPDAIVDDYLSLPTLPYGTTITIDKIGCLNYNPLTKEHTGILPYKHFRSKCPAEFPECKDPDLDYTDDEQVSPVIITSGNVKYRVKMVLWFPLCDVFSLILSRQSALNKKLLPIRVLIDEKDQFMVNLMNLGLPLPAQKR
ncbi:hypothetical protein HA402_002069 [Bradysia odoriphaga]|nr:hypothetical protein HA402_002069 [Bradysia odoriphaga]